MDICKWYRLGLLTTQKCGVCDQRAVFVLRTQLRRLADRDDPRSTTWTNATAEEARCIFHAPEHLVSVP